MECAPADSDMCRDPQPLDGKMSGFTDFLGHTTTLSYETDTSKASAGFMNAVTDPNGHTTQYTRQTKSWGIKTITHPDGTTIQQTFWPVDPANGLDAQSSPWYLASRTDENGNTTTYTRDTSMRIIRKDYPDGGWEEFDYNASGEVTTHRRCKDGTNVESESFVYDTRGLTTSWTDAAGNVTSYTYY